MALTPAERKRRQRERDKQDVTNGHETSRNVTDRDVVTVTDLLWRIKALEERVRALEDGPRAVRAAEQPGRLGRADVRTPPEVSAERPGLGDLQTRIDQVVTRPEAPMAPTPDPRMLTGQALRDYVRRYGPIPTDDPAWKFVSEHGYGKPVERRYGPIPTDDPGDAA